MPTLIIETPCGETSVFAWKDERVTLGRNPANTFALDNRYLSGYHSEFRRIATDRYVVSDLGSFNGTFVNGKSARDTEVREGDRLIFGLVTAEFRLQEAIAGELEVAAGSQPQKPPIEADKEPQSKASIDGETAQAQEELALLRSQLATTRKELAVVEDLLQEGRNLWEQLEIRLRNMRSEERAVTERIQSLHRQLFLAEKRLKDLDQTSG